MTARLQPHRPHDMPAQLRNDSWRICCQSSVLHRFDCQEAVSARSRGPLLPVDKEP